MGRLPVLPVYDFNGCTLNFEALEGAGAGGTTTIVQSTSGGGGTTGSFVPLTEVVESKNVEGNVTLASPLTVQIFRLTIKAAEPKIKIEAAAGQSVQVYVIQDGTGSRKPLFEHVGGEVRWGEGSVYEATATAEAEDWLSFSCPLSGRLSAVVNAMDMK